MLGTNGTGLFVVCVAHLFNVMVYYFDDGTDDDDDKQMTNVV